MPWKHFSPPKFHPHFFNDLFGHKKHDMCGVCGSKNVKNKYKVSVSFKWGGAIFLRRTMFCQNGCEDEGGVLGFSNGTFGFALFSSWQKEDGSYV